MRVGCVTVSYLRFLLACCLRWIVLGLQLGYILCVSKVLSGHCLSALRLALSGFVCNIYAGI